MQRTSWVPRTILALSLAACAGGGTEGGGQSPEPLTATSELEEGDRVDTRRSDHEEPVVTVAAQPSTRPAIAISRIEAGDAEDGAGNIVHAAQRIAVDLDARAFPPRALDPVLTIGTLTFHHYSHPHAGVLRFALRDASQLPIGAEVSVQYGRDTASRRVLLQAIAREDLAGVSP